MEKITSRSSDNKAPSKLERASLRVEDVVQNRGWDFIEDDESAAFSKPEKNEIFSAVQKWCEEHRIDSKELFFKTDQINIRWLKWDRPLAFLPFGEAFLIGFNYVFILGLFLGSIIYSTFPELHSHLLAAVGVLVLTSLLNGYSIARRAQNRRRKLLLPRWETFAQKIKLG